MENSIPCDCFPKTEATLPLFVLDTCSALNLLKIHIRESPVLQKLVEIGRVRICKAVWNEVEGYLKVTDEKTLTLKNSLKSCIDQADIRYCTNFIEDKAKKEARKKGVQIDDEEISAAALALWLSRSTSGLIILVTDDFDICEPLRIVINTQSIGSIFTSFEVLLFLFTRLPELSKFDVESLLKDLRTKFPEPKDKSKESKAQIQLLRSLEKLKEVCRYEKCPISRQVCYEKHG